ncbi:type II toxin-antitoxin system ParD family antitoxin [Blastomonas sp.]|uniref:ribbon-helix-helix domain-containing protein n=1 Tax=Blastomonas sp. TaxID=1909299 RepID=UPI0035939686
MFLMSKIEKLSIALTADLAAEVREAVASGMYATSSEVIREALRDWSRRRAFQQTELGELRRLIQEGHDSGYGPWEGIEAIIAEARRRFEAQQTLSDAA